MFNAELLKILCCPETYQELHLADAATIEKLNQQIADGRVKNRAGQLVKEKLTGGLIRADGKYLYPIHAMPVLLVDGAIPLQPEPEVEIKINIRS